MNKIYIQKLFKRPEQISEGTNLYKKTSAGNAHFQKLSGLKMFIVFIGLFLSQLTYAGEFSISPGSTITIKGKSSLFFGWKSDSKAMNGKVVMEKGINNMIKVHDMEFEVPVKSIKSSTSFMERLTYNCFKESTYPNIAFKLQRADVLSNGQAVVTGSLSFAGKSKTERVIGRLHESSGTIIISGKHSIDMTEYDMEPPTAMMGVLKVKDTVEIDFNLILK